MTLDTDHIILAKKISDVPAEQWNALAGDHPTVRHEYLNGLEVTGCASPETGWAPHHILLYRKQTLVGAMPLYLKFHSRGEFVFDHAWAHAFQRHGDAYYPKLLCAVPFTPVPGPRVLASRHQDKLTLINAAVAMTDSNTLSTLHILFPHIDDLQALTDAGLMTRTSVQFHWTNQNYANMDDFLGSMNQKNRKKIRQSRRKLAEENVQFQWIEGSELDDKTLDFFYRCYCQTYLEHGHPPYLNSDFFYHLRQHAPESMTLILATKNQEPIAAAMNLRSNERLYGRYWGCLQFVSGLHFETCYMQGIEYCIDRGLNVFEGGAQGEHKLARGLLPVQTYSAHWVRDPAYARAIKDFLSHEREAVTEYVDVLDEHRPFRRQEFE